MSIGFDFSIFTSPFLVTVLLYAAAVGVMTGICASVLGVNLVLKRYSMIGDGLSHVGFLALAIAAVFGVSGQNELYVTVPVVVLAAFLLMWLSSSGKLKGDAATALVSVGTMAVGYIIFSIAGTGAGDVCAGLFGASILNISKSDLIACSVITALVLCVYVCFYKQIFSVTFDESFARASGINVGAFNMLLSALIAVTVVIGMKLIGAVMISAVIVIPAVTAMRLFKSFRAVVVSSGVISVLSFLLGFLFAVTFTVQKSDSVTVMLPVGATVVCFEILVLIIASVISKLKANKKTVV